MKPIITTSVIAVAVMLFVSPPSAFTKGHEDASLKNSYVPEAVRKTAEEEAKGGKILRWEREHGNYEVVVEKDGKQWGIDISETGKVLGRHDESKEHNEKNEKH